MKIELAQYAGFCMGVRRALSLCRQAVQKKNFPLRTLGPIIHNTTVIDELESSGIKSVKDPSQIEKGDYVLIRTHGVTPQVRQELMDRGARIIDATCPKVARVQGIIRKNVADGYFIVIIGDHGHAETQGLLGYAEGRGQVLSTRKEVEDFIASKGIKEKICVVAQTTQELEVFNDLCSILNSHFNDIKIIDTICDATRNRQEEIRHKARGSSSIFVVGGKNSANTTRLYEIAKKICPNTHHIERADEIDAKKISDGGRVFVTAGAPTPMWVAHEILDEIGKRSMFNMVLRMTGSKYAYWVCALLAIVMTYYVSTSEQGLRTALLLLGGAVLASRGMSYYYMKRLDVIRLDYFYGRIALAAGIALLVLMTVFFSYSGAFFLLYYCILFYVVYKNVAIGRNFFFTLCNLVFLAVPLVAL